MFRFFGLALVALVLLYCGTQAHDRVSPRSLSELPAYRPLAAARETETQIRNYEATVPPQCYTKTNGTANPCWVCHTNPQLPNELTDWELQEEYAFSDQAMTNHWRNLFQDRSDAIQGMSDEEILAYVRGDNYRPLMDHLQRRQDYQGYVPDLDFDLGFDEFGFARDGSGWRAFRYKPFLGTFFPTNGSTDDVLIRLPRHFQTKNGHFSQEIYKINLAILEAVIAAGPAAGDGASFRYPVEPLDEAAAGTDLNGDGAVSGVVTFLSGFPRAFVGDAAEEPLRRYVYPSGVEFLHSVRYLDPDKDDLIAKRMKELRYSRKVRYLDSWAMSFKYEKEYNEKEAGTLPRFPGAAETGVVGDFGWLLQGFIEDEYGRLRVQTREEHQFCMGCHNAIGVTVDQTFALARKVPGASGWAYQNVAGIQDVPQQGHDRPEIATYLERVGGGDEFRANGEMIERFFENGSLNEAAVAVAAPGGRADIRALIFPSRERALLLNKAYRVLVLEQSFVFGRDAVIGSIENVHASIENGDTDLKPAGKVFKDGRLWLDWQEPETEK